VPTYLGTFLTLAAAGLAACIIPALRALRVNPVEALRNE
jgi:ABC-type antimicrobial peptide transport system permease subunit